MITFIVSLLVAFIFSFIAMWLLDHGNILGGIATFIFGVVVIMFIQGGFDHRYTQQLKCRRYERYHATIDETGQKVVITVCGNNYIQDHPENYQ